MHNTHRFGTGHQIMFIAWRWNLYQNQRIKRYSENKQRCLLTLVKRLEGQGRDHQWSSIAEADISLTNEGSTNLAVLVSGDCGLMSPPFVMMDEKFVCTKGASFCVW